MVTKAEQKVKTFAKSFDMLLWQRMETKPRLYILDANALLHRAWHALPPLTNPEGKVVNAVYGVMMLMLKLIAEKNPDAFAACWDTEAPTFRHEAYKEYKAQREEQPQELYDQVPFVKEGLALLGVDSLEMDGFEADDLLGTLALRAKKSGWDVVIVTGDRDALQLVQPGISVLAFKKGVSDTIVYDEEEVKKQYGLTPGQFLEYKAMRGDPSDNIPGIRGIGEKGATDLLQRFHSLKGVYAAAHDSKSDISKSVREKLLAAEKEIPAILSLVTIKTDVPIAYEPKAGSAVIASPDALRTFFVKMGFKTLLNRIPGAAPIDISKVTKQKIERLPQIKKEPPRVAHAEKSGEFEDIRLERVEAARAAIEEARCGVEIVVHAAHGAEGSLFAKNVEGCVLGVKDKLYFFSNNLLSKQSTIKKAFAELMEDPAVHKAAHDAKSVMVALETFGFRVQGWTFDTMLAAYLLAAGDRSHDLPSIAMRYANVQLPEEASAFRQAEAVAKLVPVLKTALEKDGLSRVMERFEMPLVPVLRKMEQQGILIDKSYLVKLAKEMQADKAALEKKMMKAAGREFNPASPSQLAEVLFTDLHLATKGIKKGKTGFSTAAPELEKLRGSHPIIEMVEEHREFAKMLSTYVEVLPTLVDAGGRIHTTYNQAVAATGRLSSTEPNLQNIPIRTEVGRKIRRAFIAEKGFQLLSCDYSQIELRIVAALAKDEKMLEAFRNGEDIHTATAAAIWHHPKEEITKDQRRIAKAINFGLIFGQGPQGLAVAAGISFADAKKFIAAYFDVYRGIKTYMDETKALAHKLGYVETLFGRRRYFPEIQSMLPQLRAQAERMAINMPVQGTDADLMKLSMIALHEKLPKFSKRTRMLLQVHDELVFEVPKDEVAKVAAFAKDVMENIEKIGVPIVVDTKSGTNWEEMKKI